MYYKYLCLVFKNSTAHKLFVIFIICFFYLVSCSPSIPESTIYIKGSKYYAGDGINHAQYEIEIDDFYMLDHEVTNLEFAEVMNLALSKNMIYVNEEQKSILLNKDSQWNLIELYKEGCQIKLDNNQFSVSEGMEDYPVIFVSWYGAVAYCNFLGLIEGRNALYDLEDWVYDENATGGYRLPTNEEWEYAATERGKSGKLFSGAADPEESAWYKTNSKGATHPVKQLEPNELGLYDMSGNIWEFCTEKMGDFRGQIQSPELRLNTSYRLMRGGSYLSEDMNLYKFVQIIDYPNYLKGSKETGFRTVFIK
ncbi:MAG: SUMF1/EgtB/PvdO family nonheme iron enzyme [Spirochaetes bacterium]|jgi:formylglycine-generating enzyme required for sulfatase activity|nr:SUMF1/EgtB/PvdO family nonheme iron enzyme [Spirochaetota bacterium]